MKKNSLTTAVVAGIAGVAGVGSIADAVNLNPDGLGQVLIYPYYTTQGGNDTLITVVNTADVGKAVKVRFLEGRNSREVLDFHLYLSPWDVWTGSIVAYGDGAGVLTRDRSCTVPDIARGGLGFDGGLVQDWGNGAFFVPFVDYAYTEIANDTGPQDIARTREGYVEVIEMANIDEDGPVYDWSLHGGPDNEPGNCLNLNAAWFTGGGQFVGNPNFGLLPGDGRGALFGNAMIVNSARGTVGGYAADAIEGFNYTYLHFEPGDVNPNLAHVNNPGNPLAATAHVFEYGNVVDATYDDATVVDGKVDAITALYASPRVINEYFLDDEDHITFSSEWVITFPTKRFYVDDRPALPAGSPYIPGVRAPFSERFGSAGSCHDVSITVFDREEQTVTPTGGGFSPRPPGPRPDALCWESQVITFGQGARFDAGEGSDILGSTYYKNVATQYDNGWAYVNFVGSPALRPSAEGVVFNGLPVTGFFATNADNSALDGGVLANYSTLFRHRTERSIAIS